MSHESDQDVYAALKRYGQIYGITQKDTGDVCFEVEFVDLDCIDATEGLTTIRIGSADYTFEWDEWTSGDYLTSSYTFQRLIKPIAEELLQPPDITSKHHILNALNDDCLRAIMAHVSAEANNLITLTNTCQRFMNVARFPFGRLYGKDVHHLYSMDTWTLSSIEDYFQRLGSCLKAFDTDTFLCAKNISMLHVLAFVTKYCVNLRHLRFKIPKNQPQQAIFRPLMDRVQTVHFYKCRDIIKGNDLFSIDGNQLLQSLIVETCEKVELPQGRFPNLVDVIFHTVQMSSHYNDASAELFFQTNTQIKQLRLLFVSGHNCISNGLQWLINLEHLSIFRKHAMELKNESPEDYTAFELLTKLREVELSVNVDALIAIFKGLIKAKAPLESLAIKRLGVNWDDSGNSKKVELFEMIGQMEKLTYLEIAQNLIYGNVGQFRSIANTDFIDLMEKLPTLKSVCFDSAFIDLPTIQKILESGKNLTKASFTIRSLYVGAREATIFGFLAVIAEIATEREISVKIDIIHCEASYQEHIDEYEKWKAYNNAYFEIAAIVTNTYHRR